MEHVKLGGVVLLALGLCLACEKKDPADDPHTVAPIAGTSGTGGSTTTPDDPQGGAGTDATEVRKGERGSSCDSTADCEKELTCIVTHDCPAGVACANKSCQPSNFNLTGTGKSCHISDCKTKADCCGDMPTQAPIECANRESICSQPSFPGCAAVACTAATADICGKGRCEGLCAYSKYNATSLARCMTSAECPGNVCDPVTNLCALTGSDCSAAGSPCVTYTNTCSATLSCNCVNADYDPTKPICTDPDCEGICGFTCKDDRCVVDDTCGGDAECPVTTPFCNAGTCGECKTNDDCDADVMCISGHCGPACKADTQCGVFEACQAGSCVYVGCRTDRECVLRAGNVEGVASQDPRLAKCSIEDDIGSCVMPCEIDAQCAPTEVCLAGICKYIGCETDSECKTIAGLHDLPVPTPERPWITTTVCKPEDAAAP
jgi:hypothetical protein